MQVGEDVGVDMFSSPHGNFRSCIFFARHGGVRQLWESAQAYREVVLVMLL